MSKKNAFPETKVDWSNVPSLIELEKFSAITIGSKKASKIPSLGATARKPPTTFKYKPEAYLLHQTRDVLEIKQRYKDYGFETELIMQDPFGHPGPTAVCPIGFPFNLPKTYPELRRYNRWICRIHVDICLNNDHIVVSVPHIEPDPSFHKAAHILDTYIKGNVVRGATAVEILRFLGINS